MNSGTPDYASHVRTDVFHLLPKNCQRVLELGAARGETMRALKEARDIDFCAAVEFDPSSAADAENVFSEVICGNLESDELPGHWSDFNLVLCLDVLEHLVNPWAIVQNLTTRMNPGATLIISVPNVSYWKVSLDLVLRGKWTLKDAGVLDRTHLRFFVRETAIQLAEQPGLMVTAVEAGGLPPKSKRRLFNTVTLGLFERFVSPQIYVVAVRT